MDDSDLIEKTITVRAPIKRVWQAITDVDEFGRWFGVKLERAFEPSRTIRGKFFAASNEARAYNGHNLSDSVYADREVSSTVLCTLVAMEPPHSLSFRWTPYSVAADHNPQIDPSTLIEVFLESVPDGTCITIRESGFSALSPSTRKRVLMMSTTARDANLQGLKKHVERS